jgi:hypothetical protein
VLGAQGGDTQRSGCGSVNSCAGHCPNSLTCSKETLAISLASLIYLVYTLGCTEWTCSDHTAPAYENGRMVPHLRFQGRALLRVGQCIDVARCALVCEVVEHVVCCLSLCAPLLVAAPQDVGCQNASLHRSVGQV